MSRCIYSSCPAGFSVIYLSAPLKRQATNRPGRPGRSLNTSITKYSTICIEELSISRSLAHMIHHEDPGPHLVVALHVALVQRAVLSIASKHDQTHQAAQTEDNLLARENHIAGPDRAQRFPFFTTTHFELM